MTRAIDYLKAKAPVQIVVVSGNHDFERMFYAGDVIKGWYRNDKNVVVDNSMESRKYVEYGVNMIMYTHGDKEKPSEMPLIMATEQPEMFARCSVREVHCGHLHKEMVNEYRGIKVRFIPSICANDDWHKTMGYSAIRTGQAYIWSKTNGLEGYLQTIVK
jgi:predicted phosphodiesterase